MRFRLRLAEYDYEVDSGPETTHKVADVVSLLQRGKKEQDIIDGEVPYFVTDGALGGDEVQPEHYEEVIAFWGNTETESWTEHTDISTLLSVDEEPVIPDPLILDDFLQAQKKISSTENVMSRWVSPITLRLRSLRDTSSKIQVRKGVTGSRARTTSLLTTAHG